MKSRASTKPGKTRKAPALKVPPTFRHLDWHLLGDVWVARGKLTMEMAEDVLRHNVNNRRLQKSTYQSYAGAISRGEWLLNGETISFHQDGTTADAQHRAKAVLETGIAIDVLVVAGIPNGAIKTINRGRKRSFADDLEMLGKKYASETSGVVTTQFKYDKKSIGQGSTHGKSDFPTAHQSNKVLEENPGLADSVCYIYGRSSFKDLADRRALAWLHYHFGTKSAAARDKFFLGLETGAELPAGSPILLFRRFLTQQKAAKGKLGKNHILARGIKAWNAWRNNLSLTQLSWKDSQEDFPAAV